MKNFFDLWVFKHPTLKKLIMEIKIAFLIIVVSVSNLLATDTYSQVAKVSLDMENRSLEQVMDEIEKQSEFYFIFNQKQIDVYRTVDIQADNKLITDILPELFEGTDVRFTVFDRKILLTVDDIKGPLRNLAAREEFQQLILSGLVKDASTGEAMPGVNIQVRGTTVGAITDMSGRYSLQSVDRNAILIFSFIGYVTQEVPVSGRAVVDVSLAAELTGLDEVVVVGYGSQRRQTLTGAVTSISSEALLATKATSVVSSLQGKLAGVLIRQRTAEPGTFNSFVSIRGFGTPLIVIDGVARGGMSDFERLNPSDIESISILKDASAAIFGMNADNGVIIVTTKKGVQGKTKFSLSSRYTTKGPTGFPESVDAYTYRVLKNEMQRNIGLNPIWSDTELAKWQAGTEPGYTDFNWIDEMISKSTNQAEMNFSMNGGTEAVTYYSSFGYMEDRGLLTTDIQKYRKFNFRTNVTANLTEGLKATISFNGKLDKNRSPENAYIWLFKPIITSDRGVPPYVLNNPNHFASNTDEKFNPLVQGLESVSGYTSWEDFQYETTINLEYQVPFVEGLTLGVLGAYDGNVYKSARLRKRFELYDYYSDILVNVRNNPSNLENTMTLRKRLNFQGRMTYNKIFNSIHNLSGTLVWEARDQYYDYLRVRRQYDDVYTTDIINQGSITNMASNGTRENYRYLSLLGRFNYSYRNKYLLEFSFREDGSYRYAPASRWAFFPSGSAGWRLSEEGFIRNNLPMINNLKIRASYGLLGADAGNPFEYVSGYQFTGITGGYVFNPNVLTIGAYPPGVTNTNLSWIKTNTADIGVDLELWKGKFGLVFDIFEKNRNGMLATRIRDVPNTFGASYPQENINKDRVRGFEFEVTHRNKIGNLEYGASANMTYARRYTIYTERTPYTSSWQKWKDMSSSGRIQGAQWNYVTEGQYTDITQYQTAILYGGTNGNSRMLPGSYIFSDINGDGVSDGNDQVIDSWRGVGTNPPLQYGLNIDGRWKGIDLNILFQGASGFVVQINPGDTWGYSRYPSVFTMYLDRWRTKEVTADPFDPATEWISGRYPALKSNLGGTPDGRSNMSLYRYDAKYVRLKTVEIGYTLPVSFTRKIKIDNVRAFVNGFNLLTFTDKLLKDLDPEKDEGDYSASLNYPLMRSFNFGFNINF